MLFAVASNLAHCLWMSPDREALFVQYPSDPVLGFFTGSIPLVFVSADAAQDLFYVGRNLQSLLILLRWAIWNSVIDKGQLGELVARLLLILCFDSASGRGPTRSDFSGVFH